MNNKGYVGTYTNQSRAPLPQTILTGQADECTGPAKQVLTLIKLIIVISLMKLINDR